MSLHFITDLFTFTQYWFLNLHNMLNLIIFNNGEVMDVFQHDQLAIVAFWKMFAEKTYS